MVNVKVFKQVISQDNVLEMAEAIVFYETRYLIGYMGYKAQIIHNELCADLKNKNNIKYALSDSYVLVQEVALYLCEHFGERLDDVIGYNKKGKKVTIEIACEKKMERIIRRRTRDYKRHIAFDDLAPSDEPRTELELKDEEDYTKYDSIVESLNLTENMRVALEYRVNGLSYPQIAALLERAQSTVYEYFTKMRSRYLAIYK